MQHGVRRLPRNYRMTYCPTLLLPDLQAMRIPRVQRALICQSARQPLVPTPPPPPPPPPPTRPERLGRTITAVKYRLTRPRLEGSIGCVEFAAVLITRKPTIEEGRTGGEGQRGRSRVAID